MDIQEKFIDENRPGDKIKPEYLIIHSTADPEATARKIRSWFNQKKAKASAHFVVDWENILQLIPLEEMSWNAGQKANPVSIGVELCETADPVKFKKSIQNLKTCVDYIDENVSGLKIVPHFWVTENLGGTNHTDPKGYLKKHNKDWDWLIGQLEKDDKNAEVSGWAREAREFVKKKGISSGTMPKEPATREEVWTMIYRLAKKK